MPRDKIQEQIFQNKVDKLMKGQPKSKPFCMFFDGKFRTGSTSLHKTFQSRRLRYHWRMLKQRK